MFFSYIWSIMLYVTAHSLSPFKAYQFYLLKVFTSSEYDWSTIWFDHKPSK